MHLKLREIEVLSTKFFFKVFEKAKSRPIEKMRTYDLFLGAIVALNQISQHYHIEV